MSRGRPGEPIVDDAGHAVCEEPDGPVGAEQDADHRQGYPGLSRNVGAEEDRVEGAVAEEGYGGADAEHEHGALGSRVYDAAESGARMGTDVVSDSRVGATCGRPHVYARFAL